MCKSKAEPLAPGMKFDASKLRTDLGPAEAIEHLAEVLTFGASKYGSNNWQNLDDAIERYTAALLRHYILWRKGEHLDAESGKPHITHMFCNAMFLDYLVRKERTDA